MYVNVGSVLSRQVGIVRHNPSVVQNHTTLLHTSAVVPSTIYRILIWWQDSFLCAVLGEAFGTHSVLVHARHVGCQWAAGSMHQERRHNLQEVCLLRVAVIWQLSRDHAVHISRCPRLTIGAHDQQDVRMWQAALLEFNRPAIS